MNRHRNRLIAITIIFQIIVLGLLFFPDRDFKTALVHAESAAEKTVSQARNIDLNLNDEKEKSLIAAISKRQKELDFREEALRTREERLLSIEKDVSARIEELNRVKGRIEEFSRKIDSASDERTRKIVKIYDSMKPEEAAARLEKTDTDSAVMVISSLSEKKAARILSLMEVGKSVKLSQALKIKK